MEETNEAGSMSLFVIESMPAFFFVNEPKPDEPEAIDESSRNAPVAERAVDADDKPGNGVDCSTITPIAFPKSSCDATFLWSFAGDGL